MVHGMRHGRAWACPFALYSLLWCCSTVVLVLDLLYY